MDKNFELYLIRHGQTAWSQSGQHTGRTDIPLTPEGEKLATYLKKPLSQIAFEAVYSSPLERAFRTSQIAGLNAQKDDDLVEWNYGSYEGIRTSDIHKNEPYWNLFTDGAPEGETASDVGSRADQMITKLQKHEGPVALFSHGHFLRVFVARWLRLPPEKGALFMLGTESISILGFEHTSNEPVIKLWNSRAHLLA